ncbi:MAG: hypothetical protein PHS62_03475 [Patescibacteria group bacterium]|nr:hypothetical protein [Patescibacteria group bacterium]
MSKFTIALLCGGPSPERAISLNSARTVLDHLSSDKIEILPVYFDYKKNPYLISRGQLYSNTPADFDFKLAQTARPLKEKELINVLKKTQIVFPLMHGQFGEDGQIQKFLEKNHLPFIGSPAKACELAFDKYISNEFINSKGFNALPSILLTKKDRRNHQREIQKFFREQNLKRAIVKPALGGSSIAVYSVASAAEALAASQKIFSNNIYDRVVLEPFCRGKEFTVIILQNQDGLPIAILPTEIELSYKNQQIFDYRRKYLATRQVSYHCPPRFSDQIVAAIQKQAEELFYLFGLRDFARFDGWLLPDGRLWFSDFNPVSGMEQNSFLFMQSSRLGMSHRNFLNFILKNSCRRQGINFPAANNDSLKLAKKKPVNVIFGGQTTERQVSVMSGTNVWLKLRNSKKYFPSPFLLDTDNQVWRLPYTLTLNHTVEEIAATCRNAKRDERRLKRLAAEIIARLKPEKTDLTEPWFMPEKMTLNDFIKKSPYIFIGLHGGAGENGQLQKMLERAQVPFNGSHSRTAKLCMDKFATGQSLAGLEKQGIKLAARRTATMASLKKIVGNRRELARYWQTLKKQLGAATVIVKPLDDGCSSGIARLYEPKDLKTYLDYALKLSASLAQQQDCYIPNGKLTGQHGIIEMPRCAMRRLMFEKFITTDKIRVIGNRLNWRKKTGLMEITCGLLEKQGKLHAFNPSITVATGNVLTLEEKFQGGTGINITPPPAPYVSSAAIKKVKQRMKKTAETLGLEGYARLDAFMNIKNGELIIIEANTLPGLTPSTVIYHQALDETPPLQPKEFLEKIVGKNY